MLLPRENVVYANLNTSFTSFDDLVFDVRQREIDGFLEVVFPGYTGSLLLLHGEIVHAVQDSTEGDCSGPEAARAIAERARNRDGRIAVYSVDPALVSLVARSIDGEVIYRDLPTAFTNLERLIDRLTADRHSGYLSAELADGRGQALILFHEGAVAEAALSADGQSLAGPAAVQTLIEAASDAGGTITVVRDTPGVAGPIAQASNVQNNASDRDVLISLWSDVAAAVEHAVDRHARPGTFGQSLREVFLAQANRYPFLDPFAAEVEYRGGHLTVDGPLEPDFNDALSLCLADAVARLAIQLKRSDLEARVRAEVSEVAERHAVTIHRLALDECLQELMG